MIEPGAVSWKAVLNAVTEKVGVDDIFPAFSGTLTQQQQARVKEQLNMLLAAVLVAGRDAPIFRLRIVDQALITNALTEMETAALPPDIFRERPDAGISHFYTDGDYYSVSWLADVLTVQAAAGNSYSPRAVVGIKDGQVFATNCISLVLYYVRRPTAPALADYDNADTTPFPLAGSDRELATELTAAYAAGTRGADPQLQAMHSQFAALQSNAALQAQPQQPQAQPEG